MNTIRVKFGVQTPHYIDHVQLYHTKRMQRLTAVAWSLDNKYVISASDEMCLRVWKARASEKLAMMRDRERVALDYNEKLKEKYGQHPKVSNCYS